MKRKYHVCKISANDQQHIHDHRFDIRHWAQNPQLHVEPFHNFIRFIQYIALFNVII